jgi:prepilin-type N-terminal cleavage/methylation domain-containing protein
MRWPARFREDEGGFTLVEMLIGMVIVTILVGAMGSALIVSLRTTGVTNARMSESHDVQITSSYLANDVQSAAAVQLGSGGNCSGASTTLITFQYASGAAVYSCGVSAGETQVVRTFGSSSVVLAHFAGPSRPTVTCSPNPDCSGKVSSVTMDFAEASGYTYRLLGSRRGYSTGAGVGGVPPGDVVLLSTGVSSPLWVQGSCPDPGTSSGCIIDPFKTALPISDVTGFTAGWSPTPLWSKLNDTDTTTLVSSDPASKAQARVLLAGIDPPDAGVNPTVEFHASSASTGALKVTLSLYNGTTLLTSNNQIGPINQSKNYDWTLTPAQTALIPASAYAHLTVGFSVPGAKAGDSVSVDGVALDTLDVSAVGLLTVKGPLYVNSTLSNAVRLTGTKTATKISILNGGGFKILSPGACSGCNHNTVACLACIWVGQQPWTSYSPSLPDPLRSLPAPPVPGNAGSCNGSGVCQPGDYTTTFSRTSNTTLTPGTYYLEQGMSITGSTSLTCPTCTAANGVFLYIAGGSVTFAGTSSFNLPASNTGIYQNIVMFQARANANPVKIAGNSGSATINVFGGIVYVPNSLQVTLATGSASLTAKAIVAQNIKVSSSVTIG